MPNIPLIKQIKKDQTSMPSSLNEEEEKKNISLSTGNPELESPANTTFLKRNAKPPMLVRA